MAKRKASTKDPAINLEAADVHQLSPEEAAAIIGGGQGVGLPSAAPGGDESGLAETASSDDAVSVVKAEGESEPEEEDKGDPALNVSTREVLDYPSDYPHPLSVFKARPEAAALTPKEEVHARYRYNVERYFTEGVGWTVLEPDRWIVMLEGKEVELTDAAFRAMFVVPEEV
jgi:hypothetical protein